MARYDDIVAITLGREGGTSDNVADHGGLTKAGVTQAEYDSWRLRHNLPQQPVTMITESEEVQLYREDYWAPAQCDSLAPPVDLCVFDTAVNSGVGRAGKILQACVGVVQDGAIGPKTLAAIALVPPMALAAQYCDQREAFYRGIVAINPSQMIFLNGWLNRNNYIRQVCGL